MGYEGFGRVGTPQMAYDAACVFVVYTHIHIYIHTDVFAIEG